MAIRVRKVDGITVALCAAKTREEQGDIYLDDGIHHALTTKFGVDWKSEGQMDNDLADPVVKKVMLDIEGAM
jgi:hypothetical protein